MSPAVSIVALATDYDETLASGGDVAPQTLEALERLRASGRKLLLVTGRELEDLHRVCPDVDLFSCVVAENGALLYLPAGQRIKSLAPAPPERLLQILRQRGVQPLSIGRSIVATAHRHEAVVEEALAESGVEMEMIFNRDALMLLPAGVDKGTGLRAALQQLHLPPEEVVGVGDAENDEPLLRVCGVSVAVGNAIPAIKEIADIVTTGKQGAGVVEVIDRILAGTLDAVAGRETCQQHN